MRDCRAKPPSTAFCRSLRRRLTPWFARHARKMPWRGSRDPYKIWLSEIMLQQTQVETVKPYFNRFVAQLPTIEKLAQADESAVLRLWEGLGYYRRARQLHKAAKIIVAEHGGRFPRDAEVVRRLPGIGRYTAGAILSIAFDAREPILEANTLRLFSRLLGYAGDPRSTEGQRLLWAAAEAVLPKSDCGRFNQALMELGSVVCTPKSPRCDVCPIAAICEANQRGLQESIPPRKKPKRLESVREAAVVVRRPGRILLLRWPEGRRWAGLWDFPRFAIDAEHPASVKREIAEKILELTGADVALGRLIATLRHSVTRFQITLECFEAECLSHRKNRSSLMTRWLRLSELNDYPLSSTGRKLATILQQAPAGR